MTPALTLMLALLAAASVTAWQLAERRPEHRPVAVYLTAVLAVDVARLGLALLLPTQGPYEGWLAWVRGADAALYLALCWGPAALGAYYMAAASLK